MKKRNLITAIVLLAICVLTSLGMKDYPIGNLSSPEVGFLPLLIVILLALLSLVLLGQALTGKIKEETPQWVSSGSGIFLIMTGVVLFIYAFLFFGCHPRLTFRSDRR